MPRQPARRAAAVAAIAIVLLAVSSIAATADDGSMETVGGAVRLMNENRGVRMVSEVVRARVAPYSATVDCEFVMKNDGPADTVLVGFPDGARGLNSHEAQIGEFRSWVDGVEVSCRRMPEADSTSDESDAPTWWTKQVVFPHGAVRRIRDRYTVRPGSMPEYGPSGLEHTDWGFWYVLETGASWKGTIGSAEIVVTLDGIPLNRVTGTEPKAIGNGPTFRWSFRNFEPGSADGSPAGVGVNWQEPAGSESAGGSDSRDK